ncbi:MAG TPA: hypothetical protein PL193_01445 [Xanthobacteraceae bacterium]|nr:hypothetical protein [Xanthobacteraceae bacterium]
MNLLRHAQPCAGHPRLVRPSAVKGVDGRDEPGHDEEKLNQASNPLNRNQTFRPLAQPAEKSRFSGFALRRNANIIPYLLNRKVKP